MPFPDDLLSHAREAAMGLAKQKLSQGVGDLLHHVEPAIRRVINFGGQAGFIPRSTPGERDPLRAARARLDPMLSFNWYCDLPVIDGVGLGWEYVEEATLPNIEFEAISTYRAGKQYHYPHHYNLGTLQLKLYEDSQGIASRYLDAW